MTSVLIYFCCNSLFYYPFMVIICIINRQNANSRQVIFIKAASVISFHRDCCKVVTRLVDRSPLIKNVTLEFSNMTKTSLDNIKLSKMCPVFMGGVDQTCEASNSYLDMETVKVSFYDGFFSLRTNICQSSIEKSMGNDYEIN